MGDEIEQKVDNAISAGGTVQNQHIEVYQQPISKSAVVEVDVDIAEYTPEELQLLVDMVVKKANATGSGTLKLAFYKEGSIKLFLTGSEEDITNLCEAIESGSLGDFDGYQVLNLRLPGEKEQQKIDRIQRVRKSLFAGRPQLGFIDLEGAFLEEAELRGADLRWANLNGAFLSGADLSEADLSGAKLSGADLSETNLSETYLNRAKLRGAELSSAFLSEAKLVEADLSRARLRGADLRLADLNRAFLSGSDLRGADLRWAFLNGTDLIEANVENTRFGNNLGLDEDLKADLKRRGAKFGDETNTPSLVMS